MSEPSTLDGPIGPWLWVEGDPAVMEEKDCHLRQHLVNPDTGASIAVHYSKPMDTKIESWKVTLKNNGVHYLAFCSSWEEARAVLGAIGRDLSAVLVPGT